MREFCEHIGGTIGLSDSELFQALNEDGERPARWRELPSVREFCEHIAANIGLSDNEVFQTLKEGEPIRRRDEKLNLTDMWRAAGADPSKRPAKWRETDAARAFIAYVASDIRRADIELFEAAKGGVDAGGTYAHWKIGIAYAEYLSPAFHSWCIEVVRDHMEGQLAPNLQPVAVVDATAVAAEIGRVMQKAMREELGGALAPRRMSCSAMGVTTQPSIARWCSRSAASLVR